MKTSQMLKVIPIATLALLMSCSGNKSEEATETQNEKVKVKVETVSVQDVEQLSEFTATVEANIKNNIAPQTPFRIEKIFAEVGPCKSRAVISQDGRYQPKASEDTIGQPRDRVQTYRRVV